MAAITLTCDKCDKSFTLQDSPERAKVSCPYCGDVNVVRGGVKAQDTGSGLPVPAVATGTACRAVAMGLPPAAGPEQTVKVVPGAMFRTRPLQTTGLVIVLLTASVSAVYLGYQGRNLYAIPTGLVALLAFGVLTAWKIEAWSERVTITTKRVILTRGILSKSTIETLHRTIQEIEIKQTFWQRILGFGRLTISNAAEGGDEIVVPAAPAPYAIRAIIDAYRPM